MPRKKIVPDIPPYVRVVRDVEAHRSFIARCGVTGGRITCPKDTLRVLEHLTAEEVEVFVVIALNTRSRVIGLVEVTRGLVDASLVHPREVFSTAIVLRASGIILAHNHPSGDPTPSAEDRAVTRQLVAAGQLLDLPVYDHVIIGSDGRYVSFATAGLL